jgi:hypothetical protein
MVPSTTCTGKHATLSSGSLSACPVQTSYRQPWAGQRIVVPRNSPPPKDVPACRQASSIAYTVPATLKRATAKPPYSHRHPPARRELIQVRHCHKICHASRLLPPECGWARGMMHAGPLSAPCTDRKDIPGAREVCCARERRSRDQPPGRSPQPCKHLLHLRGLPRRLETVRAPAVHSWRQQRLYHNPCWGWT